METLEKECGVYMDYMDILGDGQRTIFDSGTACFYESGCWLEGNGFSLRGVVRVREETRDAETNAVLVSDRYFDPEQETHCRGSKSPTPAMCTQKRTVK